MSNPLFQQSQQQITPNSDMNRLYSEFQQSPTDFLVRMGLNIPTGFNGDYRALVEYLARSGQIPPQLQGRVNAMLSRR